MEQEIDDIADNKIDKTRQLTVRINKLLNEKMQQRVNLLKLNRNYYSKKRWLLEALYEKLDRDEENTKKLLKELASKELYEVLFWLHYSVHFITE